MKLTSLFVVPLMCLFCAFVAWAQVTKDESGPALLSYDEIIQLYQQDVPPAGLSEKLNKLLTTPFVSNAAYRSGVRPWKPSSPNAGKVLRVAEWNIERGLEFDAVKLAYDVSKGLIGFARNVDDPTVRSIPIVGKNSEASFFTTVRNFRFDDGNAFDFRGAAERSSNGRSGNLADSNERGGKGFVPTSELGRTYGPIGKYKLDWIFVRPERLTNPHDKKQPYRFAPHFGRTLKELNESIPERISDHCPITVDLPLAEPSRL